ncbi:MAG: hypothetical protein Greene07144_1076 [Parcubacteria group bacterium Greene0714_4]|nr:MAG: hypothetical protein Greene07144_1076 [Parcubacteria group bacterium Greene0714_4]
MIGLYCLGLFALYVVVCLAVALYEQVKHGRFVP